MRKCSRISLARIKSAELLGKSRDRMSIYTTFGFSLNKSIFINPSRISLPQPRFKNKGKGKGSGNDPLAFVFENPPLSFL